MLKVLPLIYIFEVNERGVHIGSDVDPDGSAFIWVLGYGSRVENEGKNRGWPTCVFFVGNYFSKSEPKNLANL